MPGMKAALKRVWRDFRDYPPSPAESAWATAMVIFWIGYGCGWFSP
jgi:hypothetical protein